MTDTFYTDISSIGKIRVSGKSAQQFIATMTTVDTSMLAAIGAIEAALVLNGDADIIAVLLVARSGTTEYMLTCDADVAGETFAWLEAHAELCDDEGKVFADLQIRNATDDLAAFALYGRSATAIVAELVPPTATTATSTTTKHSAAAKTSDSTEKSESTKSESTKSAEEDISEVRLTSIMGMPVLLIRYPLLPGGVIEFYCQPAQRQTLENLLLSFAELDPNDFLEYRVLRAINGTWFDGATKAEYQKPDSRLARLMRANHDFVGGRAYDALG
jgi:hypothetical protein